MSSDLLDALMNRGDKILFFKRLFCLIMWEHLWFQAERHLPLLAWRRVTSISKIQLFDHMQIIILLVIMICWLVGCLIVAALMFATWLPPALFSISGSGRDWSQQRGLWQALQHRLYADRVAGRHPLPSATAFLWSHLLCKTAVLFTRNCYQRRGQKKTITCPEQLISVSCICMSAKILPYTETLRRGPSKPVQGLRALSSECT